MRKQPPKNEKGKRDLVTYHRRYHILLFIVKHRITSYVELQREFGVTPSMIKKDLDFIEAIYCLPLIRERGRPLELMGEWNFMWPHFTALENQRLMLIRMHVSDTYRTWIDEMIREYGNPLLLGNSDGMT